MNQKPSSGGQPPRDQHPPGPQATRFGKPGLERQAVAEVETFRVVRWISGESTGGMELLELPDASTEQPYAPVLRPAIPILTVLDDGSLDAGEQIRIRKESFVIGRSSGDLVIPVDNTMSGRHAEIRCTTGNGRRRWTLHNLESVNGTFVRVSAATLGDDMIVLLGSRRFRFENPPPPAQREAEAERTFRIDNTVDHATLWPVLVEAANRPNGMRLPIQADHVTIGRKGSGCGIELDDPQLASVHAEIFLDPAGIWKISGRKTRNGVWVTTTIAALQSCCFFQCGEQRFKFVTP